MSPFTFQSGYIQINEVLALAPAGAFLYIPIWLYSNNIAEFGKVVRSIFTFQSGYIQMLLQSTTLFVLEYFTFQSGYIQIVRHSPYIQCIESFTFQSGYIQMIWLRHYNIAKVLYIPIWLYSNMNLNSQKCLGNLSLHSNLVIFKCK